MGSGYSLRSKDPELRSLTLQDIGFGLSSDEHLEDTVVDCLDLIRSLVQGNSGLAEDLVRIFDSQTDSSQSMEERDLVGLVTSILEDGLGRFNQQRQSPVWGQRLAPSQQGGKHARLITSALSVLEALLAVEGYGPRVWLYLRSSPIFFPLASNSSGAASLFAKTALASERLSGEYPALLTLLRLIHTLFLDASSTLILPSLSQPTNVANSKLYEIKEEVLMRAATFIHSEVWVDYMGWKYVALGERFEIGRTIVGIWADVLQGFSPLMEGKRGFEQLSNVRYSEVSLRVLLRFAPIGCRRRFLVECHHVQHQPPCAYYCHRSHAFHQA